MRIDEETDREVSRFACGLNFSQVVREASAMWLRQRRRGCRNELVRQSGRTRSEAEQQEMEKMAGQADRSVLDLPGDR